jgi:hypothetical protein
MRERISSFFPEDSLFPLPQERRKKRSPLSKEPGLLYDGQTAELFRSRPPRGAGETGGIRR